MQQPRQVTTKSAFLKQPIPQIQCGASRLELLDSIANLLLVGPDDLLDLLAILEEEEGGHRPDAELLREVRRIVDVELVERSLLVFGGKAEGTLMRPGRVGWGTYVAMVGAMNLHGPHLCMSCQRVGVRGAKGVLPFGKGIEDDELVVPIFLDQLDVLVHSAAD
jgi:hypothetical protein